MLASAGKGRIACNQVLYHLQERAIEHAVIPWCEAHGVSVVAYSPFATTIPVTAQQGGRGAAGDRRRAQSDRAQIALSFLTRAKGVLAIQRLKRRTRRRTPRGRMTLSAEEIATLDKAFPRGPKPGACRCFSGRFVLNKALPPCAITHSKVQFRALSIRLLIGVLLAPRPI